MAPEKLAPQDEAELSPQGARDAQRKTGAVPPFLRQAAQRRTAAVTPQPAEPQPDDAPATSTAVKEGATRSSNMVSIIVIISRITGFFRTYAQAWALGAAGLASAYTVANNLPNLLYELVVGGMLITSFLPVYLSVRRKLGREGASAYASNLLSIVTVLMVAMTVLSFILAGPIIWTQSAGATEGFDPDLAVWFFRWFVIEIVLYALSSIFSGVLNAERKYIISNVAPIFNNLIIIGSFVAYGILMQHGGNEQLAMVILALGNPLGVAVQAVCQLPSLYREGVRLTWRINLKDPALRETLSIGIPTLVATLASVPTTAVMSSCALQCTPAGASIAYYARIWYILPYSVFAIPISLTFFTELSNSFVEHDIASFKDYLSDGTRKVLFTLLPLAMFLVVFATPLAAVLASGKFDELAVRQTAGYLQALALSLPFYALSTYLQKVCSSMMRMGFFMVAVCVASAIQVVLCILLTPVWGLYVVPVSSLFFYGAVDLIILLNIRRTLGAVGMRQVAVSCAWALVLGLAGSLVGGLILRICTAVMGPCMGIAKGVLYAAAGGLPALLVTFGLATLLGVSDAPFFDRLFARVLRRRSAA